MAYLALRNTALSTSSITTSTINSPSTITLQGAGITYATVNSKGIACNTGTITLSMTSASYSTTTLIATLNFTAGAQTPVAGQWITVSGASVSGYNGTFLVITGGATSLTVQNYNGTALGTSTGTITIIGSATQGITFGDSSYRTTNSAPIITMIMTNSAVAGTPMAYAGNYTTPIGAKYLRVRMVGGGGGGNGYTSSPNAGIGGYSQFGNYIAFGGNIGLTSANSYYNNTAWVYAGSLGQGGLGGGLFQITAVSNPSSTATITINSTVSTLFVTSYLPVVGQTITIQNMVPIVWNGTWTITASTTSTISFSASGLGAGAGYGMFVLNPPDTNTVFSPGGSAAGGQINTSGNITGSMGGSSMLGGSAPGWTNANYSGNSTAQPAFPLGAYCFGGGGQGSFAISGGIAGNGGGAGMYIETYIANPTTSYKTVVGQGGQGAGGDPGARYNASPGFNGVIIVEAYF